MITVSKEDYLKAILEAQSEGESVISATLVHWLSVSPPAVTMAVRRLRKDGLVRVQANGAIRLTAAGRKIAGKLALRHHLIERMLAGIFGMEHAVSPDFEAKLLAKLGGDGSCPHGNLSELESPRSRHRRGLRLLANVGEGKTYLVSGIHERDRNLLEFLDARGIRPGGKLKLLARNYDQTLSIRTKAGAAVIGGAAAEKIWVRGIAGHPRNK
jgi:DtxR family transcriptional regulator, iron-dependent repressor